MCDIRLLTPHAIKQVNVADCGVLVPSKHGVYSFAQFGAALLVDATAYRGHVSRKIHIYPGGGAAYVSTHTQSNPSDAARSPNCLIFT